MIEPKEQIRCLERVNLDLDNREKYLRLDKNEFVGGMPADIFGGALQKINFDNITMYPEYKKLKEKIAEIEGLKAENVILGNGSDAIIKNIFETYIDINHDVLLTDPTFAMYPIYCKMFEAGYVPQVKYKSLDKFPKEEFLKKLEENNAFKMAVIVNPNNPTGSVVDNRFILKATEIASQHDVLMVVDEAYHYFHKKTVANYVNDFDNLIVLRTFSKFFGLAGLRIGFGVSNQNIITDLRKVQMTYPVDCVSVAFAREVLDDPKIEYYLYDRFNKGKLYLINKLNEHNMEYHVGNANFILIKCNQDVVEKLKDARILIKGGFKQDILKDYIRVTLGDENSMKTFWHHFERYVND